MRIAALLLSIACASVAAAEGVQTFDGHALTGTVAIVGRDAKVGDQSVPLADCDAIDLVGDAESTTVATIGVWLVDGGWLPAAAAKAASVADAVAFDTPYGAIELPLTAVLGWGPLADDHAPTAPADGDRVVLAADGSTLDGTVQGVAKGELSLKTALDDQPIAVPLANIARLRLGLPEKPPRGLRLEVALDAARPPVAFLPGRPLRLACAKDATLTPPAAGWRARVEGGRRSYLGALEPKAEEEGAFGRVWHWKRDTDLEDGPLLLHGARYAHGLTVHSRARLTWALDGGYDRLRAQAGISDLVGSEGDCAATLSADGKTLWSRDSVRGGQPPIAIDLDLRGAKSLVLFVDYGARYDIGDHFCLADAYLVKKAEK